MSLSLIRSNYISSRFSKGFPAFFLPISPIKSSENKPASPHVLQLPQQGRARNRVDLIAPQQLLSQNLSWEDIRKGAVIGLGAKGTLVKELQRRLTEAGFPVSQTGELGPTTQRLLKAFQKSRGVQATGKLGPTTLKAFETKPQSTSSWESIRKGKVLARGDRGPLVKELQKWLTAAGFSVAQTGEFGPTTEAVLKKFQARFKVGQTGKVGPTTLKALEASQRVAKNGAKLAKMAEKVARRRGTTGWCYAGAAESIRRGLGDKLWGGSAYMAAAQLTRNKNFMEIKVKPHELKQLPKGAVVVWNKRPGGPHGHISIALGNGREASDHIRSQFTSLRGRLDFRVFLPVHA